MEKYVALSVKELWNKYQFVSNIDSGSFGSIQKVQNTVDKQFYAMKVQNLKNLMTSIPNNYSNEMLRIIREINTFKLIHPNITKFYESYFTFEDQFVIVTELAESNICIYRENTELTNAQISNIMIQIVKGTIHLHNQNIMHRDLSPDNILVFENGKKFKICDFGLSQMKPNTYSFVGKPFFKAPEIDLNEDFSYSSQVDIWSLGMILYYLCTKKYKYQGKIISELKKQDQTVLIKLEGQQQIFERLLNKMLQLDPHQRLDSLQVLFELCDLANESLDKHLEIEEEKKGNQGHQGRQNRQNSPNYNKKDAVALIKSTNAVVNEIIAKIGDDGSVYDGLWKNDKKDGYGRFVYVEGNYCIAEYKDGLRNGYGKYYSKDGWIYEGQYINDQKEGLGLMKYKSGDQYYGYWVNGMRQGLYIFQRKEDKQKQGNMRMEGQQRQ
ncbi:protein kinase domain containing protein [Stylonychia lemnae]|uniref:Protein kinase domain containing protein n=1 Tax=Stylonychia lemnae TaxID=5949 RepID=A0A078BCB0_STYLE|nr:protein kinase domain containing protein [Stylonychia lemnae]|eukprot:CDW91836.1 protein kinase domain containing protein [Stylonychia lemnae]